MGFTFFINTGFIGITYMVAPATVEGIIVHLIGIDTADRVSLSLSTRLQVLLPAVVVSAGTLNAEAIVAHTLAGT